MAEEARCKKCGRKESKPVHNDCKVEAKPKAEKTKKSKK